MERRVKIGLGGGISILGVNIPLGDAGLGELKALREAGSLKRGVCPRCGRMHSGLCGIPGTATGYMPSARPRVALRPKREPSTPIYPPKIEPRYDLFEEGFQIKVILEMPGAEEKEIRILLEGQTLKVNAGRERQDGFYEAEIKLPRKVKTEFSKEYRNGILTITLSRED